MKTTFCITLIFILMWCSSANAQLSATSNISGTLSVGQDRTTTVIPGSYTCVNETVDATGRATSISNGSCSGGGGSGRALLTGNIDEYFNCSTGSNTNVGTSGGMIDATGFSFSGSAAGPRANAISTGVVNANSAGQGLFPGSVNGAVNTGGFLN